MKRIPEHFLHYLWKYRLFFEEDLLLTDGSHVSVQETGTVNSDAGPDFFNARIRIGSTLWAGDVEIHVTASDWLRHGHQHDPAYDSVILHVVAINDLQVTRRDGEPVPTVRLSFDHNMLDRYTDLLKANGFIPCQERIREVERIFVREWLTRLGTERLLNKSEATGDRPVQEEGDWDELLHLMLGRCFGMPLNTLPFELLAAALPLKQMLRFKDNTFALEALLFGKAGMLDGIIPEDPYMTSLTEEYDRLRERHDGNPIPGHMWKFLRLRPSSFPTIRIAQFAALISQAYPLKEKVLNLHGEKETGALFNLRAGDYWNTHYRFGRISPYRLKKTGRHFAVLLIINAVAPFMLRYGKAHGRDDLCETAIRMLEELRPEKNALIKKWTNFGIIPENAYESQALLQLYHDYCEQKRCLSCQIGIKLISEAPDEGN